MHIRRTLTWEGDPSPARAQDRLRDGGAAAPANTPPCGVSQERRPGRAPGGHPPVQGDTPRSRWVQRPHAHCTVSTAPDVASGNVIRPPGADACALLGRSCALLRPCPQFGATLKATARPACESLAVASAAFYPILCPSFPDRPVPGHTGHEILARRTSF